MYKLLMSRNTSPFTMLSNLLPYTLFENPMTFNVFGLLKIQKLFYKNVRVVPSEAPIKLIYLGDTKRLTTEMGERRGCENLTDHRNDVTWGLV